MCIFSDNPTIQQCKFICFSTKYTSINKIYGSIEYLVTLRYDCINNLPVDLFMTPVVLNGKLYHTYYFVTIDLISVFKSKNCIQGIYKSHNETISEK